MQTLGPWVSVRFGAVLQHLTGPSGSLWRNRARHRQWRETANPANEAEANRFPKRNFGSVTVAVAPGASRWPTWLERISDWKNCSTWAPIYIPKCQGWQLMAIDGNVKICQNMSSGSHPLSSVLKRLESLMATHGPIISLTAMKPWEIPWWNTWNTSRKLHQSEKGTVPEVSEKIGVSQSKKLDHDHVSIKIHHFGSPSLGNLHVYVKYLNLISTIIQRNNGQVTIYNRSRLILMKTRDLSWKQHDKQNPSYQHTTSWLIWTSL